MFAAESPPDGVRMPGHYLRPGSHYTPVALSENNLTDAMTELARKSNGTLWTGIDARAIQRLSLDSNTWLVDLRRRFYGPRYAAQHIQNPTKRA